MGLYDENNLPPANFGSLIRKRPKKRFLVKPSSDSQENENASSPTPTSPEEKNVSQNVSRRPDPKLSIDENSDSNTTSIDLNLTMDETSSGNKPSSELETTIDDNSPSNINLESSIDEISTQDTEHNLSMDNISTEDGASSISDLSNKKFNSGQDINYSENESQNKNLEVSTPTDINLPSELNADISKSGSNAKILNKSNSLNSSMDDKSSPCSDHNEQFSSIDANRTPKSTDLISSIVNERSLSKTNADHVSSIDTLSSATTKPETDKLIPTIDNISLPGIVSAKLKSNFTKLTNHFFSIWTDLDKTEKILLLYLYRSSFGWNKTVTNIPLSIRFLEKALPLTHNSIPKGLKGLIAKGLIQIEETTNIGTVYRLTLNAKNISLSTPINEYYTALDNNIFELSKICSASDLIVYLLLYRQSFGFNQNVTKRKILTSHIAKEIGLSTRRTQDAIRNLLKNSLIERASTPTSKGVAYRVYLPQERRTCETVTEVDYNKLNLDAENLETSMDILSSPNSSIASNTVLNSNTSIDVSRGLKPQPSHTIENNTLPPDDPILSMDETRSKETENTKKTSSEDAADFFGFLNSKFENPSSEFPIAKKILHEILGEFGLEKSKHHLDRLLPKIKEANSPVGFWRHSLNNPENFPELNQKTKLEVLQEQRKKEAEERSRALILKQKEQEKIKRVNTAWNELDEMKQNEFILKSEEYFRDSMHGKLPPRSVVVNKAKKLNFGEGEQIK